MRRRAIDRCDRHLRVVRNVTDNVADFDECLHRPARSIVQKRVGKIGCEGHVIAQPKNAQAC
jgi:hypothetical protein